MPGATKLFTDFCAGNLGNFLPLDDGAQARPSLPLHWTQVTGLLSAQNPSPAAAHALESLCQGAGTVVTGQQVGLFGGPMYTPLKAATAIARARKATAAGRPHAPIFWLASEDHDFDEIGSVIFPIGKQLRTFTYAPSEGPAGRPVGSLVLDDSIVPLVEEVTEILGASLASEALTAAYKPGQTLAQAFGDFYRTIFAAQGLLVIDASSRAFHRIGSPVLRPAIEQADEFYAALLERNQALEAAGYHAQVAVTENSSLLFLIEEQTGARVALKRTPATAEEPKGLWQAGEKTYSTADLIGILESEPERISPSALLRPVFQDFLLSPSAIVGGPAEIAYYAQSAVLYKRILDRQTPAFPRLSVTLIEPQVAELLRKYDLTPEQVFTSDPTALGQHLAQHSLPEEGKRKITSAGEALEGELDGLVEWMQSLDKGLGQSAETAAGKMRYQMERLRRLAENFILQKEATLGRQAQALHNGLFPNGGLQDRVHGAAYYFARHGLDLAEALTKHASGSCAEHLVIWV